MGLLLLVLALFLIPIGLFFWMLGDDHTHRYRLVPCNGQTKYLIERTGRFDREWRYFDELKFGHKSWSTYSEEDGREMIKKIREDDDRFWKEYYEREKIKKKGTIYVK